MAIQPLVRDLLALTRRARDNAAEDPFGNPAMTVALAVSRRLDSGAVDEAELASLVRMLRDAAFADRAARLGAKVSGADPAADRAALAELAGRLAADSADVAAFMALVGRTRFAAVFTAHPTFSLPTPVGAALAAAAGGTPAESFDSHRPPRPTLDDEFTQASAAIGRGRDALDVLNTSLLEAARARWPAEWQAVAPRPVVLASWVGYDTDGRTDIGWWDTLRLRLRMKLAQLARVADTVPDGAARTLARRAMAAVERQIAACPAAPEPAAVAAFAQALVGLREEALTTPAPLLDLLAGEAAAAGPDAAMTLLAARAGLAAHGLGLAHTHVRLNAAQLHNAVRLRLGLAEPPSDPSRRRVLLAGIEAALDSVQPVPVDFGALLAEQASATRLMMLVAQIVKHVDASVPVRFLIAETESGYTLLAALWLARLFGIAGQVEISPLFETADALERGGRVLEEALRSSHWRAYLRETGRLCLQFGYSDSGRYLGQIPASYLIERLRLKAAEALARHGMAGIEVVLFDTHGESVGRGAHPGALADRLQYLSPPATRQAFQQAGIPVREESAFQGGDGYLLFGTPALALGTVARIAEHALGEASVPDDPVYADADTAADVFALAATAMRELVEDPGYAALLGAFGPALLDPTGSRPAIRQGDGSGPATIRHPRELRAIPNNAILQQVGWMANTLHGLGEAASRHPEAFAEWLDASPRFRRAMDLAAHAAAHSDLDVLRAVAATLDPGSWLDRAAHATLPGQRDALVAVAGALERRALWAPVQAMFRRVQADHLRLRAAWPDAPRMSDRLLLLHALRLAAIHRIWLLGTEVPDFSPRHGTTRRSLEDMLLRLDVPGALDLLAEVFPPAPDAGPARDFAEPAGPRAPSSYAQEHAAVFEPMRRYFALTREIGAAITHEVGAFG